MEEAPQPREPVRQERAEHTRSRIIEAAAIAFAEHGLDGISLNDVVKRSGLSKGAFYFHFSSRGELALAVFRAKQEQLLRSLAQGAETIPTSAAEALADALRRRNRLLAEDASLRCVTRLGNELNTRSRPDSDFSSFHDPAIQMIAGLVRQGQTTGEFRDNLEPSRAARAIFAWVVGLDTLSLLSSDGEDLPERSEELLALLLPGLLSDAAAARRNDRSESGRRIQ